MTHPTEDVGTDELLERVALALCAREADVRCLDSDGAAALWRLNRGWYLKEARVALEAFRSRAATREDER